MHHTFHGALPKTSNHDADKRAFFPDDMTKQVAYGSGLKPVKPRFAATDAYLQSHPNIKGWSAASAEQWPVYQTYGDAGRKHFGKNPTYSSQPNTTDIGEPLVPVLLF